MTDLAALSIVVTTTGVAAANQQLDTLVANTARAESATTKYNASIEASIKPQLEMIRLMREQREHFDAIAKGISGTSAAITAGAEALNKYAASAVKADQAIIKNQISLEKLAVAQLKTEEAASRLAVADGRAAKAAHDAAAAQERASAAAFNAEAASTRAAKAKIDMAAAGDRAALAALKLSQAQEAARNQASGFATAIGSGITALGGMTVLLGPFGIALTGAFAVEKIKDFTLAIAQAGSQFQTFTARVAMFTGPGSAAVSMMDKLFESAQRTGSAFESTIGVFTRVSFAARDMGATSSEVARFTETVQKLGRIGGGGLQETNAAMVQLGQALASGRLGGDELRSILEGMPALARAISDGLGVSVGNLRAMGAAGQLTADKVFGAIIAASAKADAEFKKLPITLEQAGQMATNAWDKFKDSIDRSFGLSTKLAAALQSIAGVLGSVNRTATQEYEAQVAQIDKLIAKRKEYEEIKAKGFPLTGDFSAIAAYTNSGSNIAATKAEIETRQLAATAIAKQIEKEALLAEQQELGARAAGISQAATKKMTDGIAGMLTALGLASEGGKLMTKDQVTLAKATEAVEEAIKRGGDALKEFGGSADKAREYLKALAEQADPIAKQIRDITNAAESAAAGGGADKYRISQRQAFEANPANKGKDPAQIASEVEKYISAVKDASAANEAAAATFAKMTAAAGDNGAALTEIAVRQRVYKEILDNGSKAAADLYLETGKLPAGFEAVAKSIGVQEWSRFNSEIAKATTELRRAADAQERLAAASSGGAVAIADAERGNRAFAFALKAGAEGTAAFSAAYAAAMAEMRRGDIAKAAADLKSWTTDQDNAIKAAKNLAEAEKIGAEAVRKATIENAIAAEVAKSKIKLGEDEIKTIRDRITALSDEQKQQSINNAIRSKQEELEIAQAEYRLVGATVEVRAKELAAIKAVNEAKRLGMEAGEDDYNNYVKIASAVEEVKIKTEQATKDREAWLEPFKNAAKGIQDAFAGAFESIFSGGVRSFADLGKTVLQIMVKLAAQIAALLVFRPVVGNVLSAGGASPSFISNLLPGFGSGSGNGQSGGGMPSFNPFNMFSNGIDTLSSGIVHAFPGMFGLGSSTMAAAGSVAMGPGGMLLGGIDAATTAVSAATASVASFASIALPVAAIAIPLLMTLFSKKPSVGPNSNATIGMRDGKLDVIDSGADNGGDKAAAITFAKDLMKTIKAVLESIGGTLKDGFSGLQVGIFKGKFFVDDTRMGGTATYEKNQFDNEADAVADAVRRILKSGVDGLSEDMKLVVANTTAKTMDDLNKDLTFGKNFRDQIDLMNAGLGTLTAQVTAFRIAAKASAATEAASIKEFLQQSEDLFAPYSETTRTVRQALNISGGGGGNDNGPSDPWYVDPSNGDGYEMAGRDADGNIRMVNQATGEFITVIKNATTGLYEFDKAITDVSRDGTNEQLAAAKAAVRNRALSAIGLGPEGDRAATGIAADYLQEAEKIKAWQKVLEAAGFSAADAASKIAEALTKLKDKKASEFNDAINSQYAGLVGDTAMQLSYALKALEESRQQALTNARTIGADIVAVERNYAEQRRQIVKAAAETEAAKERARVTTNASLDASLLRYSGRTRDADLMDFDIQAEQRRRDARAAGVDMVKFEAVIAKERLAIIDRYANDAIRATNQTAIDTYNVQINAQQQLYDAAARTADVMTRLADSLDKTRVNLRTGPLSPFSGEQRLTELAANYNAIKSRAFSGDAAQREKALGELGDAATKYAEFAKSYYGGNADYSAIFNEIDETIRQASQAATTQASIATQQRDYAKAQVELLTQARDALVAINNGLGSNSANNNNNSGPAPGQTTTVGGAAFEAVATKAQQLVQQATTTGLSVRNGDTMTNRVYRAAPDGSLTPDFYQTSQWRTLVGERQAAIAAMTDTSELVRILYQYYGGRRTADANGDTGAVEIVARLRALGVPGYAAGGFHSGGLRLVGEHGPELEATGAARYWTAAQTASMVGSNDNSAVCARLERIETAIRGQTAVVAKAGDMNNEGHARTANSVEEIKRKSELAAAA